MIPNLLHCAWATCEADSRPGAAAFLAKFDEAAPRADTLPLHRVSVYLGGGSVECLGQDLRRFATGQELSASLRSEITAYQLCMPDDSMQESPHAVISHEVSRSRAGKTP